MATNEIYIYGAHPSATPFHHLFYTQQTTGILKAKCNLQVVIKKSIPILDGFTCKQTAFVAF